ncbi:ORF6N domain-containing protein [Mariniflexile sp.]|uniref:ORF6N domain-containing protein n=1 Tax=Mariniflexile sp. TaxID=1979402 RepID=UPI0040475BA0
MNLEEIQNKIYSIRHQNAMFDFDLAQMYQVETRVLKQAVRRNMDRFPKDFMFQLTKAEWDELITICDNLPENIKFSPTTPFVFTEQGVAMLSSVLKSKIAIEINITIIRAFVYIRQYALSHRDLTEKLNQLENKYNQQFKDVSEAINYLLQKDKKEIKQTERKPIGFK